MRYKGNRLTTAQEGATLHDDLSPLDQWQHTSATLRCVHARRGAGGPSHASLPRLCAVDIAAAAAQRVISC